ncbi:hypothetical protein OG417_35635 [Actinoallomurus sp. NBC_01490]|jgi:hypothetical protein|uniref:hypothetical protein n=1 Tax=Actinoallomurus sp. NBC_01490 TaxID=2903557 RepID=UPI002E30F1D2|nr:hypothetical protein [Actinoallomurus sp. NBC_01490]
MIKASLRSVATLAVAAVTATVAGVPVADAVPTHEVRDAPGLRTSTVPAVKATSGIRGRARMYFPAPGNHIWVTVDAHSEFGASPGIPTRSWGTFRIYHGFDQPGVPANWGDFEVDCLTTGGPTATVTGRLVRTTPGGPWEQAGYLKRHIRMGVSFYVAGRGAGPSRIGLSAGTPEGEPLLTRCMAPAADAPLIRGGYTLKDRVPTADHGR